MINKEGETKTVCASAKAQYIRNISDLLEKCTDVYLIELIYQILLKASLKR